MRPNTHHFYDHVYYCLVSPKTSFVLHCLCIVQYCRNFCTAKFTSIELHFIEAKLTGLQQVKIKATELFPIEI